MLRSPFVLDMHSMSWSGAGEEVAEALELEQVSEVNTDGKQCQIDRHQNYPLFLNMYLSE